VRYADRVGFGSQRMRSSSVASTGSRPEGAGVSVFAVSRFMGSSIAMIDYHYGHLARDSREHAISLLDALAIE
jgi:hypothetical protein